MHQRRRPRGSRKSQPQRLPGHVLGLTVVLTIGVIVANLVVDIVHAVLDPRVRERVV